MADDTFRRQRLTDFIREIWDEGLAHKADQYVAAAYTIHHDPGDPWDGMTLDLEGFKDRVRTSRAAFPDQCFAIQRLFVDGAEIAMTWLWSATHTGDLPGFPATGKTIHMSGATVCHFDENDKLTGHWQITDRLGIYQQLHQNQAAV